MSKIIEHPPQEKNTNASPLHTDDVPIRNIGFMIVLMTFGVFGTWSAFAPIDSSALATGQITVKSHKKTVQHPFGGIVKRLNVKDGDIVTKGDELIVLDDTEIRASLEIIRSQHITLLAQMARLLAERDGLKKIIFSDEFNRYPTSKTRAAKKNETHVFSSRKNTYLGEKRILNERIKQISSKIRGLRGQISSKKDLRALYRTEIKDLKELLAEGFANKQRLQDIERNDVIVRGEISALTAEIASSQMQQSETRLQIVQIGKEIQQEVAAQVTEVQTQLYDIQERLLPTEDRLNRMVIKAPESGQVMGLAIHTEGGVIGVEKPILDIVPQDAELIIDAQVSPLDIDRVHVGLVAEVRFSSFKQGKTPTLEGRVIYLSADSFIDEKTGASYYRANIELDSENLKKLGELQLLPGMPAEVLIITGERTVFEYLAQPITNAFARTFIED